MKIGEWIGGLTVQCLRMLPEKLQKGLDRSRYDASGKNLRLDWVAVYRGVSLLAQPLTRPSEEKGGVLLLMVLPISLDEVGTSHPAESSSAASTSPTERSAQADSFSNHPYYEV